MFEQQMFAPDFVQIFLSNFYLFSDCFVETLSHLISKYFLQKKLDKILFPYNYCGGSCKSILRKRNYRKLVSKEKHNGRKKFGHFFSDFPNMGNGNNLQIVLAVQCLFTASIYFSKKIVQIVNMTFFTIPVIVQKSLQIM